MPEITARDVIGTAYSAAAAATAELKALLNNVGSEFNGELPERQDFLEIAHLLNKALSDVLLAQHQMSDDWADTTYVGRWDG